MPHASLSRTNSKASAAQNEGPLNEIRRWVNAELMPWRFYRNEVGPIKEFINQAIKDDPSVFHFSIEDGIVFFHEKPSAMLPGHDVYRNLLDRGEMYRKFLQAVIDASGIIGSADLAIDLDDLSDNILEGPVFCFQKIRGARTILVPDVDILDWDFYLIDKSHDYLSFNSKFDMAIFVGSTTGMLNIDRKTVESLDHKRIKSAVYFKNDSDVRYELPGVVQCDSPETENLIRSLGIGHVSAPWSEQLSYRYLISVDGNGATCSRVAISLKSNSVLLKYNSNNVLYYFHGLEPWKHYVPIDSDVDLKHNINFLRNDIDLALSISSDSKTFYKNYLSRISVIHYTAELLKSYIATFGILSNDQKDDSVFLFDSFAHVKNQGDVWSNPNGWLKAEDGNWVEGFGIIPGPRISENEIHYRTIDQNGHPTEYSRGWCLSGSRGQGQAIYGIEVQITGDAKNKFLVYYEASFADGSKSDLLPAGTMCVAKSLTPITGFRFCAKAIKG